MKASGKLHPSSSMMGLLEKTQIKNEDRLMQTGLRRYIPLVLFSLLLVCGGTSSALATYSATSGFGTSGVVQDDLTGYDDQANGMVEQSDGDLVVVGTTSNGTDTDIFVARYTSAGVLDSTFGDAGVATFDPNGTNDAGYGIALLDDGTFVIVGSSLNSDGYATIVVMKLSSTGSLVSSFADDGVYTYEEDATDLTGYGIALDSNENILVAGTFASDSESWGLVLRLSSSGVLDSSFGSSGLRQIEFSSQTSVRALAVDSDDEIFLAGMVEDSDSLKEAAVFMLDADGDIDTSYGSSGAAIVSDYDNDSSFNSLSVLSSGIVTAVGYREDDDAVPSILAAKFSSSGKAFSTFGTSGLLVKDYGYSSTAYAVTQQDDGTILIAGEYATSSQLNTILLVLDSYGDTETDGELLADIDENDDSIRALAYDSDVSTRIYLAGYASNGSNKDVALLSYSASDDDSSDDDDSSSSSSSSSSSDNAFKIVTESISGVNATSAMSGGIVTANSSYDCDDDDCPTVEERGVVYAITPYPSYDEDYDSSSSSDEDDDDDDDDDDSSVFPDWVQSSAGYSLTSSGQTSDGSGDGTYGSYMEDLTPKKTYYVRAYVVLSDDTVLYGNQLSFKTSDACFIATAAFGSILEPHVKVLRTFRDKYLEKSQIGRFMVGLYYRWSPNNAAKISQSSALRLVVRILMLPIVFMSYFLVYNPLMSMIALIILACGVVLVRKNVQRRVKA